MHGCYQKLFASNIFNLLAISRVRCSTDEGTIKGQLCQIIQGISWCVLLLQDARDEVPNDGMHQVYVCQMVSCIL